MFLIQGMTDGAQAQKNKMVKGTIKEVQLDKNVLIINEKVKKEFVTRELSIESDTTFIVTIKGEKKEAIGAAGLELLKDAKGANVQVKCDKDVKVIQVKVNIK
jgi:hypothetical protein